MFDLIVSIASSTILIIIIKLFEKYKVDTFQAIVLNYWVCVVTGSVMLGYMPFDANTVGKAWFPSAVGLGVLFITGFYSIGITLQRFGLTIASVMQKMSLIVSVPFAIWAFQESVTGLKIAGIALALAAVVMTNIPAQAQNSTAAADTPARPMWLWIFPIYAFVNSGTIECILQYTQGKIINTMPEAATEGAAFTMASFGWAGLLGGIVMLGGMALGKLKLTMRTVVASIVLGIPNYFSIFFLLRALNWQDKSVILPTNNIAIVAISVLTGYFLFRERLSIINVAGVVLAIGAILLLAF